MNLFFRSKPKIPASTTITIDGAPVVVSVRVNARSRSYRLSLPATGPVLTLPPGGKWGEAEAFLLRQRHWLAARLTRQPEGASFSHGSLVPLRGVDHRIIGTGRLRGRVEVGTDTEGHPALFVPGEPAHQARRLTDWLKTEAHDDLVVRSAIHAERLGVTVKSIKMRSQASRWGSCSSTGTINYNWRLVMAPPHVLDYVAAHEVAHLVEMNHSPAFWAAVKRTLPDMERGRAWLKAHGRELMAHGG